MTDSKIQNIIVIQSIRPPNFERLLERKLRIGWNKMPVLCRRRGLLKLKLGTGYFEPPSTYLVQF
jgi:hypothetical protein